MNNDRTDNVAYTEVRANGESVAPLFPPRFPTDFYHLGSRLA